MLRRAGIGILTFVLSVMLGGGCALLNQPSSSSRKSSRKSFTKKSSSSRKTAEKPDRSGSYAKKPRGSERVSRKSRRDAALADVDKPKESAPPAVKVPRPAKRPPQIAAEELETLAERRSQIEECELIPIPKKRDFWLSIYYQTGELIVPEDKRSVLEKREPHQAVIQIRLEGRSPVYYFNGKRVDGADQLEVKLIQFREDVIAERHGNKYLQPQAIIDAEKNLERKHIEVVFNACFWARIRNIQSEISSRR
ncbi:MAG: hypothetical protein ACYS8W_13175 [Planctomycetota bacterium]|jgi:hypothetical protein